MINVIATIVINRAEHGAVQAAVRVTQEANGVAIWHDPIHADPRLLAWHAYTPTNNTAGVEACALLEARRIAREAIDHGMQYSELRSFVQR